VTLYAKGVMEGRYEYDVFGVPYEGETNNGIGLGYTGKAYDPITGLYNYGYRDYAPKVARFTSEAPIRGGVNWFAYVNNDPVNWVDPDGRATVTNNTPDDIVVKLEHEPPGKYFEDVFVTLSANRSDKYSIDGVITT
jgi:RHS repeat-associated protein